MTLLKKIIVVESILILLIQIDTFQATEMYPS